MMGAFGVVERYKVKITVLKRFDPTEVFETPPVTRVSPIGLCDRCREGQEFMVGEDLRMPEDFCPGAWHSIYCNVRILAFGGNMPWFREKGVAVNICPDALRPVIFKLERT